MRITSNYAILNKKSPIHNCLSFGYKYLIQRLKSQEGNNKKNMFIWRVFCIIYFSIIQFIFSSCYIACSLTYGYNKCNHWCNFLYFCPKFVYAWFLCVQVCDCVCSLCVCVKLWWWKSVWLCKCVRNEMNVDLYYINHLS